MPIVWSKDKFYSNDNIKKYDSAIKKTCVQNDIPFIQLIDLLEPGDLADGLHPNSRGHEKIFEKIKNFLLTNKLV